MSNFLFGSFRVTWFSLPGAASSVTPPSQLQSSHSLVLHPVAKVGDCRAGERARAIGGVRARASALRGRSSQPQGAKRAPIGRAAVSPPFRNSAFEVSCSSQPKPFRHTVPMGAKSGGGGDFGVERPSSGDSPSVSWAAMRVRVVEQIPRTHR